MYIWWKKYSKLTVSPVYTSERSVNAPSSCSYFNGLQNWEQHSSVHQSAGEGEDICLLPILFLICSVWDYKTCSSQLTWVHLWDCATSLPSKYNASYRIIDKCFVFHKSTSSGSAQVYCIAKQIPNRVAKNKRGNNQRLNYKFSLSQNIWAFRRENFELSFNSAIRESRIDAETSVAL